MTVQGLRTRLLCAGARGPAVILVHGGGMSADVFLHNVDRLGTSCRAVALDLPGCGLTESGAGAGSVLDACVQHLHAVADLMGFRRYCVLGSSLGAQVAVLAHLDAPYRVPALILTPSASAFFGRQALAVALKDALARRSPRGRCDLDRVDRELRRIAPNMGRRGDLVRASYATVQAWPGANASAQRYLTGLLDCVDTHAVSHRLASVDADVLVVWGGRDPRVALSGQVRQTIARLPRHELHIFRRSGHLPFLEEPRRFNRLALRFLDVQVSRSAAG